VVRAAAEIRLGTGAPVDIARRNYFETNGPSSTAKQAPNGIVEEAAALKSFFLKLS
jgi:hypothetical protein